MCNRAYATRWAAENKTSKRASLRKYYAKNAAKFREYSGVKTWAKRLLKNAELSTRARGLEPMTIDEAWILEQEMTCPYTGVPLLPSSDKSLWQPSLDRVDNARGYTPENTRLTSLGWNLVRNDRTVEQAMSFLSHVKSP